MLLNYNLLLAVATLPFAFAQDVTVPNECTAGYSGGTSVALVTVPYTYDQVMSVIGSYKNLTWSGNPDNTVTLNGTDNTVGTARTYDTAGAHVIETILSYSKPPAPGPYEEVHNTALLSVPTLNVSFYIPYDGTVVSSICDGKASMFNFTANFCGSNATTTEAILTMLHTNDALTVGKFLGGQNFTSCAALGGYANGTAAGNGSTPTASAPPVAYTGGANGISVGVSCALAVIAWVFVL